MRLLHATASGLLTGMLALSMATSVAAVEDDYDAEELYNPDPWEPVNRAVFRFNDTLDTYALRPVARGYDKVDRKSTRLNSSHVRISYAVFCLKKKKIRTN